jgi:phosphohistidine swiveling domain-containing protein
VTTYRTLLGTKAETLARLAPLVRTARVLPQVRIDAADWAGDRAGELDRVAAAPWSAAPLVVRSSALVEDASTGTQAGRFHSELGVTGRAGLAVAVDAVFGSYGALDPADQVLVQPMLTDAVRAGAACSCDPGTGAPYQVVSWSEGADTAAVTTGSAGIRTWYGVAADPGVRPPAEVTDVVALLTEVVGLTGNDRIEIEFGVSAGGGLYLFQARPLAVQPPLPAEEHPALLAQVRARYAAAGRGGPGRARVLGSRPLYGVMPDWNPAEIIGVRPRRLAASLYRRLITDRAWAEARHRYGYRDLRGVPLMVDFGGLPYIDVRASFSSLVPAAVGDGSAGELVDHYLDRLAAEPHLHDKVEFEIVLSCAGFDLPARLDGLAAAGFGAPARDELGAALIRSTNALLRPGPVWRADLDKVARLAAEPPATDPAAGPPSGAAIGALLDHAVARGSEPFAGLARAAFVAVQLLDGLVTAGALTPAERAAVLGGLNTVAVALRDDFHRLDRAAFLGRYGHLRPGTYDLLSPRYDEDPDRYFDWTRLATAAPAPARFVPTGGQSRRIEQLLRRAGLDTDAAGLLDFITAAIRGREWAKFVFTRVLSDALVLTGRLGAALGLTADDMSHVPVDTVTALTGAPGADRATLLAASAAGRAAHAAATMIALPPLVRSAAELSGFEVPESDPTFVTRHRVRGRAADIDAGDPPAGAIAFITSGDPGYDWLLARGVTGLVTAYGGVNSHMAIRAHELDIPAVIGVGEARLRRWLAAGAVEIDCDNRLVREMP